MKVRKCFHLMVTDCIQFRFTTLIIFLQKDNIIGKLRAVEAMM